MKTLSTTTKRAQAAIKRHATKATKATLERLRDHAKREDRSPRWIDNRLRKHCKTMGAITDAPEIQSIDISVEWKKSRTWGANPTATVEIRTSSGYDTYTGTASGCGYDKESAAVAEALNQSPSIQKLLVVLDATRKDKPYGYRVSEYGASFSGGVGISAHRDVFEACGFKWDHAGSGKSFDVYTVTR